METSGERARENWLVDTKVAGARNNLHFSVTHTVRSRRSSLILTVNAFSRIHQRQTFFAGVVTGV